MLSEQDLGLIDNAVRDILSTTGIKIEDDIVYEKLLKAGAGEGSGENVVLFPEGMIDDYLKLAPSGVKIADRRGNEWLLSSVKYPGSESVFWTGAALLYLDGQDVRFITQKDLSDFSWLVENLSEVDGVVGTSTEDTFARHRDFVGLRIMAVNTRKHLRALVFTPEGAEALVEMGKVLAGKDSLKEKPVISIGFTAHGPLRWTSLALGVFRRTAGYGIPCTINGEPMAGASSPVTLAGTIVVGTAEILSGIILNQVLEEGRPCFFNLGFAHVMDMRSGFAVTGGPENILLAMAGADLARYYKLPSVSWMCSDSLFADEQNALEKAIAASFHLFSDVNVIWGVGQLESEKALSPIQAIVDNEIIGMVRKVHGGIDVNEDTIALDTIKDVGITGNYLATEHTLANFRNAIFESSILVRKQRESKKGNSYMRENAEEYLHMILSKERKSFLSLDEEKELKKIEGYYREKIE